MYSFIWPEFLFLLFWKVFCGFLETFYWGHLCCRLFPFSDCWNYSFLSPFNFLFRSLPSRNICKYIFLLPKRVIFEIHTMILHKSREKKEKMWEGKKERRTKWLMEKKNTLLNYSKFSYIFHKFIYL